MDSITQLTLGAAVGEVVLGRKVGNRAMVWGAIAGTLPDLDVFSSLVADETSSLAFHRAITHSLTYAALSPFILGWLVSHMYDPQQRKNFWRDWALTGLSFFAIIALGSWNMPIDAGTVVRIAAIVTVSVLFFPLVLGLRELWRKNPGASGNASWQQWAWLFFWSIVTHPLLDACTSYGTQLFRPFADTRVAISNISVADPIYTLPFLICVIIAFFTTRKLKTRRLINWIGIGLSSAYMLFSFYNKWRVNEVFERSLAEKHIAYQRFTTTPAIFNNILWQCVAETDSAYYYGLYSLLDKQNRVLDFERIPKNHNWIEGHENDRDIKVIKWFSNGYYNIVKRDDNTLQLNDLRFGLLSDKARSDKDYVFKFLLHEQDGKLLARQSREAPEDFKSAWNAYWNRVGGI